VRLNDDVEMQACAVHVQIDRINASASLFSLRLFVLDGSSTVRASGVVIGAPFTSELTRASGISADYAFSPHLGSA